MEKTKNGKHYYSFDEYAEEVWGLKPYKKVTNDKQKLESQREKFLGTCPYCKKLLRYVYGTNIVACENNECKGKKITIKGENGNDKVIYKPYHRILQSNNSSTIGMTIFDE